MKYIPIIPSKFLEHNFSCSDTTMTLVHLIEAGNFHHTKLREFKKQGGKIYLDNSYYELRRNMTAEELAKKANLIEADVITLPDTPLNPSFSKDIRHYIKRLRKLGVKGKMMAVVFANHVSFDEDLLLLQIIDNMKEIDIIAIPYVFRKKDEKKRHFFLDIVEARYRIPKKEVHLFGCNSFENLLNEKRKWISSIDGTLPWKCGYYNLKFPIEDYQDPKRPHNYFNIKKIDKEQENDILYNLDFIKSLCEEDE